MKPITAAVTLLVLLGLSAFAFAQSLTKLAPPGAMAVLSTQGLVIKQAFLVRFEAKWNELGMDQFFNGLLAQEEQKVSPAEAQQIEEFKPLMSLNLVGQSGLVAVYPGGSFFIMARPSPEQLPKIMTAFKKSLTKTEPYKGWIIESEGSRGSPDQPVVVGYNQNTLMIASKDVADRFFAGDRGLSAPLIGDLVFWVNARPLYPLLGTLKSQGLPPELGTAGRTFVGFAASLTVRKDGLHTRSILTLNPREDAALTSLLLPQGKPWPLSGLPLPTGASVSSSLVDLPALGKYIDHWLNIFQINFSLNMNAFSDHFAQVTLPESAVKPSVTTSPIPMGNSLFIIGAKDPLTAETLLLSWLQQAAGFASGQGASGFKVSKVKVGRINAEEVQAGMLGQFYLAVQKDRLLVATSKEALKALSGPTLGQDAAFSKMAGRIPSNAVSASFGNAGQLISKQLSTLTSVLPMTVRSPKVMQQVVQFSSKFEKFISFVADQLGPSISYSIVKGDTLESRGFMEVNW